MFFFWNGTHGADHKPSDTSDLINVPGMKRIADLRKKVIVQLAGDAKRPEYVAVSGGGATNIPKGPRLGIAPDYEEGKEGLKVAGLTKDGVADTAGIKTGDLIVEISGKKVKNIETYMTIMAEQKIGQTIEIGVMRMAKRSRSRLC